MRRNPKRRTTPDPRSNPNLLTHPFYNNIRWPILATVGVFLIWSLLNRRCWSTRCVARPLETLMSALGRTIYSYGTQLRNTLYVTQRNPQKQAKHKNKKTCGLEKQKRSGTDRVRHLVVLFDQVVSQLRSLWERRITFSTFVRLVLA